jgi:hypothetical protein
VTYDRDVSEIIPLVLLVDAIFIHPITDDPNSLRELIYLSPGVPILVMNLWAWGYPRIIEIYFFGKDNKT